MHLDQIIALMAEATAEGKDVARVHSGDPSLYGAIAEQMRRLDALGIPYEVVPGVSSYQAAAAALKLELTPAGRNQTVILTRAAGNTGLPDNEDLAALAAHRTGLCLFLSAAQVPEVVEALAPHYGLDAPVVVAHRVSWPDQQIHRCTLADLGRIIAEHDITRTTLILIGPMLDDAEPAESHLYDADYSHLFRKARIADRLRIEPHAHPRPGRSPARIPARARRPSTLACMAALVRRGLIGPGVQGRARLHRPGHHAAITGRPSRNLDTWLLDPEALAPTFRAGRPGPTSR